MVNDYIEGIAKKDVLVMKILEEGYVKLVDDIKLRDEIAQLLINDMEPHI